MLWAKRIVLGVVGLFVGLIALTLAVAGLSLLLLGSSDDKKSDATAVTTSPPATQPPPQTRGREHDFDIEALTCEFSAGYVYAGGTITNRTGTDRTYDVKVTFSFPENGLDDATPTATTSVDVGNGKTETWTAQESTGVSTDDVPSGTELDCKYSAQG
jgi:hypothetical protein